MLSSQNQEIFFCDLCSDIFSLRKLSSEALTLLIPPTIQAAYQTESQLRTEYRSFYEASKDDDEESDDENFSE